MFLNKETAPLLNYCQSKSPTAILMMCYNALGWIFKSNQAAVDWDAPHPHITSSFNESNPFFLRPLDWTPTHRFEGLVAAGLGHVEDFELGWHHSGRVFQELEVWLRLFLLLLLLLFILLLLLTLLDLLRQRSSIVCIKTTVRLLFYDK